METNTQVGLLFNLWQVGGLTWMHVLQYLLPVIHRHSVSATTNTLRVPPSHLVTSETRYTSIALIILSSYSFFYHGFTDATCRYLSLTPAALKGAWPSYLEIGSWAQLIRSGANHGVSSDFGVEVRYLSALPYVDY